MSKEEGMNIIRKALLGGAWVSLALSCAVPAVALAKTAKTPVHKGALRKVAAGNARVKAIQGALDKHGARLKVDGLMGPKTEAAMKRFQSQHHLKATGTADKATLKALGIKA